MILKNTGELEDSKHRKRPPFSCLNDAGSLLGAYAPKTPINDKNTKTDRK